MAGARWHLDGDVQVTSGGIRACRAPSKRNMLCRESSRAADSSSQEGARGGEECLG